MQGVPLWSVHLVREAHIFAALQQAQEAAHLADLLTSPA